MIFSKGCDFMGSRKKATSALSKKTTSEYFGRRFNEALAKWKKESGKTQDDFSKEAFVSPNMITRYKKGEAFPSDAVLEDICKVLGVDEDCFIPTGSDEYKYSSAYITDLIKQKKSLAEDIGLNIGFMDLVINSTNFIEEYPFWTPIDFSGNIIEGKYQRRKLAKTEVDLDEDSFMIRDDDGKSIILSDVDLHIMKDIQDKVVEYIRFLYFERKKIMQEQEQKANKEYSPDGISSRSYLTPKELCEIDAYMKYLRWINPETNEEFNPMDDERK